ncbi:hypothetical protein KPH14_011229 [Odynerus spinipes]|uniref:Uncharacterized protein n=1 Tax=Odynerus spinipes TaxID=1348599 RepID=A0AAD9VI48_9HYME|nr:hypothetical protein KPH14_011229 [Odynerus spinipes]
MPIFGCTKENNCRRDAYLRAKERAQRDKERKRQEKLASKGLASSNRIEGKETSEGAIREASSEQPRQVSGDVAQLQDN